MTSTPNTTAFLVAADVEAGLPVSVGLASGQLPPQLRELMFLAAAETEAAHSVGAGQVPVVLPPQLHALADRLATVFRSLPAVRAAEFEHSISDFIDKWLSQHKASA